VRSASGDDGRKLFQCGAQRARIQGPRCNEPVRQSKKDNNKIVPRLESARESGDTALCAIYVGTGWWCVVHFMHLLPYFVRKSPPVPTEKDAEWAPQQVFAHYRRYVFFLYLQSNNDFLLLVPEACLLYWVTLVPVIFVCLPACLPILLYYISLCTYTVWIKASNDWSIQVVGLLITVMLP
jgi:hypothetical protein